MRASMGPRSEERGEECRRCAQVRADTASMGPRSEERGELCREASHLPHRFASMGPRSEERGEGTSSGVCSAIFFGLQWGRAPRSAERRCRACANAGRGWRFNGAALRGARREGVGCLRLRSVFTASMGPRSEERGEVENAERASRTTARFNGAALRGARRDRDARGGVL